MRDRNAPLGEAEVESLAWTKMDGLLPAVVQDSDTGQVLMLGYMSRESLLATLCSGKATFYSRSKQALWEKGETSGHSLEVAEILADCDDDALLVKARPAGPTCHLGTTSCFGTQGAQGAGFLGALRRIVRERAGADPAASYTARLLAEGVQRVAQKVGEEGVELALAAVGADRQPVAEEAADLLYHLCVLMETRELEWNDIAAVLAERHAR
jgi:phosphoribosyl-ATP pyrophosphohydrolase/phosphoribosyl-AMP cyclohydrolase